MPDDRPIDTDEASIELTERIRSEWEDGERPSTAVVEAVAAATGLEPPALPPLYESVEATALDDLVTMRSTTANETVDVSFSYADVDVSVGSDGRLEIRPDGASG